MESTFEVTELGALGFGLGPCWSSPGCRRPALKCSGGGQCPGAGLDCGSPTPAFRSRQLGSGTARRAGHCGAGPRPWPCPSPPLLASASAHGEGALRTEALATLSLNEAERTRGWRFARRPWGADSFRAAGKASRERHSPDTSLPRTWKKGGPLPGRHRREGGPPPGRHRLRSEAEPSPMEGPIQLETASGGFHGGPGVERPLPAQGTRVRSWTGKVHVPQSTEACAPQPLSRCSGAPEQQPLTPGNVEPGLHTGSRALPLEGSPSSSQLELTETRRSQDNNDNKGPSWICSEKRL